MLCLATQYFKITYIQFEAKTPVHNFLSPPIPPELLHWTFFSIFKFLIFYSFNFCMTKLLYLSASMCNQHQPQFKDSRTFNNPVQT